MDGLSDRGVHRLIAYLVPRHFIKTVAETNNDVKWLKQGLQALLERYGISIEQVAPRPDYG